MFLIFDVEAVFLFPWAVVFPEVHARGLYEMMIFSVSSSSGGVRVEKRGSAMEMRLGEGYQPDRGNTPADSVFDKVLPNAVTAKSQRAFRPGAQVLPMDAVLWTGVLRPSR